jgi:16S rRNA (cytidine1402-2'-O)-methyltransferase
MGTLYLVSTPIGNLEDITLRAARVLREVDLVLAEDTRRTGILLRHLEIGTPVRSFHEHNEAARLDEVIERLDAGQDLALVSDAGTPLVSDPGARLVARAAQEGWPVVPVPGPSAVLAALVTSGLPVGAFTFLGFPPRKGRERREVLERVASSLETVVLFESPDRTGALLAELARTCDGTRAAAVARELTKVHEEVRRGTLDELARYYRENAPRGEISVVVSGRGPDEPFGEVDDQAARALALALLDDGLSPSRAAREVARRLGVPRNRVYALVQELAQSREGARSGSDADASSRDSNPLSSS